MKHHIVEFIKRLKWIKRFINRYKRLFQYTEIGKKRQTMSDICLSKCRFYLKIPQLWPIVNPK